MNQQIIVDYIQKEINQRIKTADNTPQSYTYLPYFDLILDENNKQNLVQIPMQSVVNDKVKASSYKALLNKNAPGL